MAARLAFIAWGTDHCTWDRRQLRWTLFTSCVVLEKQLNFSGSCSLHRTTKRVIRENIQWHFADVKSFLGNYTGSFSKHRVHCRADTDALINPWPQAGSLLQELAQHT